ncbi:hypothetical protein [Weissella halotolerans]|uniref:Uncharacterized protein n=1 Tax=Weissella halotolerans DSM 20190 TaxID=1123500 RepID=A0A0R2FU07_9LACO|nr:hypothetical protein [Weissella halotolerans]KRN31768.1 hypothetical protein IV68_GL001025 [Weissella halotolerans DSM 20190]
MLIRNQRTQRILLILSTLGLGWLIFGHLLHVPLLNMLDTLSQSLTIEQVPSIFAWLTFIPYLFGHPFGTLVIFTTLLFCLWGFKYKIPAAWLALSLLASEVVLLIADLLLTGLTQPHHFFNHTVFWLTWLYSSLAIFVLPEIKRWRLRLLNQLLLLVTWLAGISHALLTPAGTFTNCLAGWWLALVCLTLAEHWYIKGAPWASRFNGFHNSWY